MGAARFLPKTALGVLLIGLAVAASLAGPAHATGRDQIKAMVAAEARDIGFPAALALAVAHAESGFDPRAESAKGARGVMQVMPATAIGEYGIHPDMLWEARVNIRLGIHFLKRLVRRYRGRTELALSYYNGGSRVGEPPRARVLPATYGYVRRVRSLRNFYWRESLSGGGQTWMRRKP